MRRSTSIVLFYLWFTASANLITEVGWTKAMGVSGTASVGGEISEAVAELGNINAGNLAIESLVSVYLVVTTTIKSFLLALSAGPRLLINVGMPIEIVLFIHAPIPLLGGLMLVYAISGREL